MDIPHQRSDSTPFPKLLHSERVTERRSRLSTCKPIRALMRETFPRGPGCLKVF